MYPSRRPYRFHRRAKKTAVAKQPSPRKLTVELIEASLAGFRKDLAAAEEVLEKVQREERQRESILASVQAKCSPLREQIKRIAADPSNRRSGIIGFFATSPYVPAAAAQIASLQGQINALVATSAQKSSNTEWVIKFHKSTAVDCKRRIVAYEKALTWHQACAARAAQKKLNEQVRADRAAHKQMEQRAKAKQKREAQQRHMAEMRAAVASANSETRDLASRLRKKMARQGACPYCGGPLGEGVHLDHIWPVSKGGRSNERNLVFACASCNAKKRDHTLAAFIRLHNLDRAAIEQRLADIGKEF